jgi:negative modulator of initiation of replication
MKKIEIDDELYHFIASNTQSIGESASDILRRLLQMDNVISEPILSVEHKEETVPVANDIKEHKCDNVFNILNKEELAMQKGVVGRFLFILSALHRTHKGIFNRVLDIKGRDRIYFATNKDDLIASGSSTNPKNITDSGYWVMTNSNTTRKKMMVHEVAMSLGYTEQEAETLRDFL